MTWDKAKTYSDTLTLGGYSDWRLPTSHELFNLLDHSVNPALNAAYFPTTEAEYWWSITPMAGNIATVWAANTGGGIGPHPKTETLSAGGTKRFHARCVRGTSATGTFTDNGNGTATDMLTGLTWGQQETVEMTWEEALSFCEKLAYGGYTDWRLPNIKELRSISDDQLAKPSVSTTLFPRATAGSYWSSTTESRHSDQGWFVNFESGLVGHELKTVKHFVRIVRGPGTQAVGVEESELVPREFQLFQNYPNPFNPLTVISYNLPAATNVHLTVYTMSGQKIRTLENGYLPAGQYRLVWDATDDNGNAVSSGGYLYRLKCGTQILTGKMLLIR
jgi:hypothetical protein